MKRIWVLWLFTIVAFQSYAQKTITGKVSTAEGETLPGVNIVVRGTTQGVITNLDGDYTINAPEDATLVFSFIGFQSQEIKVDGKSVINVVLANTTESLDEVVVVGYGEMRKSDVTGSIVRVQATENVARQYSSVDLLMKGRAAGVQVISNAGSPGSGVSVRIRGTNSLRGNNEPLYVVDGIIINSAAEGVMDASSDANELQTAQSGLTGINPRDIESLEVLKDASATAIYGSRGANGVVLITTKKGKDDGGKAKIGVFGTYEMTSIAKKFDVLNPTAYARYQNEVQILNGNSAKYQIDGPTVYSISNSDGNPVIGTEPLMQLDWQNEIYEMSETHNEGITISGANAKTNYYVSAGFTNQKGIVETSNIKRGDFRLNLGQKLTKKLKLDSRFSMMYQDGSFSQGGSKSGGNRSFTKQVLSYKPLVGSDDEEDLDLDISNPYAWLTDYDDLTKEMRLNSSISLDYKIAKHLSYQLRTGLDYRKKERSRWWGIGVFKGQKENGALTISGLNRYSYNIDNLLKYNRRINKVHNINATVGVTTDGINVDNSVYEIYDFPLKTLRTKSPQSGQLINKPLRLYSTQETMLSYLGRANYSFRDKYVLTATFRADGSSKFAENNRFGYFPSASFAWRLSEEGFIKNIEAIQNLKLRAGWGQVGNSGIPPYSTRNTYGIAYYVDGSDGTVIGNIADKIANPTLTWETTEQYNVGVDISLFGGRLNAVADVYHKRTKDLLQQIQLGPSNGFQNMQINRGEIENKGIEFSIDGYVIEKKDISLNLGGHISFNRNKVLALGLDPSKVWIDGVESEEIYYEGNGVSTGNYFKQSANVFMEGQPIGMFWGYETNGIYQDDEAAIAGPTFNGNYNVAGDVVVVDQNGDGDIGDEDKTFIGNPNPDFTYGFNLSFNYKNFTLSALVEGVYGNEVVNGSLLELGYADGRGQNVLTDAYESAWRSDAPSNMYPRIGYSYNNYFTDRIVEDGSYTRLSNVTIGYDLPIKGLGLEKVNLYVTGRNLLTLTNYSGYDPQVTSFMYDGTIIGVDWLGTPNARTVLFGMNISF